jgi:hypothetical protein
MSTGPFEATEAAAGAVDAHGQAEPGCPPDANGNDTVGPERAGREMTRRLAVYVLSDPRDGVPRYVGVTGRPADRLRDHHRSAGLLAADRPSRGRSRGRRPQAVTRWAAGLLQEGVAPVMTTMEEVRSGDERAAEKKWIAALRTDGADLLNASPGGEVHRRAMDDEALRGAILAALRVGPRAARSLAGSLGARWSAVLAAWCALEAAGKVTRDGKARASRFRLVVAA